LVAPTVGSGEVEGSQNYVSAPRPPNNPFGNPYRIFTSQHGKTPQPLLRDPKPQTTVRLIACREHFTASDAKPIKSFNAVQNDRLRLRELPQFV